MKITEIKTEDPLVRRFSVEAEKYGRLSEFIIEGKEFPKLDSEHPNIKGYYVKMRTFKVVNFEQGARQAEIIIDYEITSEKIENRMIVGQVETNIRDYAEDYPVFIYKNEKNGRIIIDATNEGGYNGTSVDLLDVISWVKKNRPELLEG